MKIIFSFNTKSKQKNVVVRATKTNFKWSHIHAKANLSGPLWQRAVITVDKTGILSLIYQRMDSRYSKVATSLSIGSNMIFTHAAFSSTPEGHLLVCLHSHEKLLSVYRVQIDFTEVKQKIDGVALLSAELVASNISTSTTGSLMNGELYDPDSWDLTHLKILPTTEIDTVPQLPPTILAVFSYSNRAINVPNPGCLVSSTIRRWSVVSVEQNLFPRFDELPSKNPILEKLTSTSLQNLPDRNEQLVVSMELLDGGQSIILTTQDGRTDMIGIEDLSSLSCRTVAGETSGMTQSGFAFTSGTIPVCQTSSPNGSMMACIDTEGELTLKHMEYQNPITQPLETDSELEVAIASLILHFSRACWTNSSIDDLLCCSLQTFAAVPPEIIISSLYSSLFRDTEFINERAPGSELEKVVQKPVLTKVLSFHAGLTYANCQPNSTKLPLSTRWVWMANNFRFVATMLFLVLRELSVPGAVLPPDLIDLVCCNIRWSLDVIRFITSIILEAGDRQTNPELFESDRSSQTEESDDTGQEIVSLLLNCHWTRIFLVAIVRACRMYVKASDSRSRQQHQIIATIHQYSAGKGLNLPAIEGLLDARWSANGDVEGNPAATAARQIEMMATGKVGKPYQDTINRLQTKLFNAQLREKSQFDRMKLFTDRVDIDWILLNSHGKKIYDIHKKKILTKGQYESNATEQSIRRCVRCGSYNEDISGVMKDWPRAVNGIMAKCVCDGNWMIDPWES